MKTLRLLAALLLCVALPTQGTVLINSFQFASGPDTTPSYANAGGTGNRTASITVTASMLVVGTPDKLVDGVTSGATDFYLRTEPANGLFLKFDFGTARVINEAKFYQSSSQAHATCRWQGSNDDATWTNIGNTFVLGGSATQTITRLSANTTAYRYYQILGTSGSNSSAPWIYEMEFKIY